MPNGPKFPKMAHRYKGPWVKALLSGDYEQGTGQLRTSDGSYCCLGVLCEVMKITPGGGVLLDHDTRRKAKLDEVAMDRLAQMNDGKRPYTKRRTFKQIATWIENNL